MPIGKASWRDFSGGLWVKGPRENAPAGSMRRATNVHVQRGQGSVLSRSGNASIFSALGSAITGLFAFVGNRYAGVGSGLQKGTTGATTTSPTTWQSGGGAPTLNGARVEFMELPSQFLATSPNIAPDLSGISPNTDFLFVSGAGASFKINTVDAGSWWGIDAPSQTFMNLFTNNIFAQSRSPKTIVTFDAVPGANWTAAGASGFNNQGDANRKVEGTQSTRLDCPRDSETILTGSFAPTSYTPIDLTVFPSSLVSTDEDYIQIWVHVGRPKNVASINLKFFVQNGGIFNNAAFAQDPNNPSISTAPYGSYYHVELQVQAVQEKRKRQLLGLGDFVPFDPENKALARYLRHHPPDKGPDLDALQFLNPRTIAVSRNTWTLVTVPKGLFDRAGSAGQAGFTWANVVGMQLSVETNKQGNTSVWFDICSLQGGVGTRGDYLYTFTYRNDNTGARSNPPYTKATDGTITLLTTQPITLDRQQAVIQNFPASLIPSYFRGGVGGAGSPVLDNQVTHIEIWRTVGNGAPGKPNAPFVSPTSIQMFLVDKIAISALNSSYTDVTADYPGMHSLQGAAFLNSDQSLDFDNMPPWTVNQAATSGASTTMGQAVYHAGTGRVFYLDSSLPTRVFYSPPGRPESVTGFLEPTGPDDPIQRLAVWNEQLFMFTKRAVYGLDGDGTQNPFVTNPKLGVPGTLFPWSVCACPNGVFYVAVDGPRLFDGATSQIVSQDALAPLFRSVGGLGLAVESYRPIADNAVGPIHGPYATFARDEVYLTDMQNGVFCYNIANDAWRVQTTGAPVTALYAELPGVVASNHGMVLAGYTTGDVSAFDGQIFGEQPGVVGDGTADAVQPSTAPIFELQTPSLFVSGENQGIVQLVYIEADTQGHTLTVDLFIDGSTTTLGTITSNTKTRFEFNVNKPANIAGLYLHGPYNQLTTRIEISSLEIQAYESAGE